MTQQRTLTDKIADLRRTYESLREDITTPEMREMLGRMTGPEAQQAVAASGDVRLLVQMVEASINIQRIISANDRACLLAAAITTQSGVVKPVIEDPAGD